MYFNEDQMLAMIKCGFSISEADGKSTDEELAIISVEMVKKFGFSEMEIENKLMKVAALKEYETMKTIAAMSPEQKKYVSGFLAKVMVADGKITGAETELLHLISIFGQLPKMNVQEAVNYWDNSI